MATEINLDIHLEIVIRSAVVGELLLFSLVCLRWPLHSRDGALLAAALCTAACMFLAMPMLAPESGALRGLFLTLTDALPYAVWLAGMYWLKDDFRMKNAFKIVIGVWAAWHVYFFGVEHGRGMYHDVSHVVAILLMLHLIFAAISELGDDLVEARRKLRALASVLASLIIIFIASGQLAGEWLDRDFGELLSAVIILISVTLLTALLLRDRLQQPAPLAGKRTGVAPVNVLPPRAAQLHQQLDEFLAAGEYRQPGLTIRALADQLGCPEHVIRKLINGHLGFRNFSAFLNTHRIREACGRLEDSVHEPVITIALDLGFGSIGPFNRAFKDATGLTPTDYRQSVRNQR